MNKIVTVFLLGLLTQQICIINAGEKRIVKTNKLQHRQTSFEPLKRTSKSLLRKKSNSKCEFPYLYNDVLNIIFSQKSLLNVFIPSLKNHERRKLLQSLACVSRKLNELITSPEFTIKVINRLSRGHNQDTIGKQIGVPQTKAYFTANNAVYRDMTDRKKQNLDEDILSNPFVDPNYCPHKRKPLLFAYLSAIKIKALIKKNADINKKYKGKSLLQVCIEQRSLNSVKLILKYKPKEKCLVNGFKSKNKQIIKLILQSDISDEEYHQAFNFLLHKKDIDNLKLLLTKKKIDLDTHLYDAITMFLSNLHGYNNNIDPIMATISLLCDHGAWNENAYKLLIGYANTWDPENGVLSKKLPQEYRSLIILLKKNAPITKA